MPLNHQNEYQEISTNDLFEGMYVHCAVYYIYNDEYVIAFQDATLTDELLKKLKKLELTYGSLFIKGKDCDELTLKIKNLKEYKRRLEFNTNYSKIKSQAEDIITKLRDSKVVDKNLTQVLSSSIKDKIMLADAADILQVINGLKNEDDYLYTHSTNVAFLNGLMGKWLKLPESDINKLTRIGLLHDLGKIMIPDEIINKPAKLTPEEFEVIKTHPTHSFNILVQSGETDVDILLGA